ncbi:MAG TPA: pitrilysin family protein [Chthoniobacteraceae bacterium]|nr:pitrilysin family protein [Chthoniobacteraceae bacterium]
MEFNYRLTTLKNGTRVATAEMPHMESASIGIWAGVGGRHESQEQTGISHFIEHLLFKGTKKRNARKITEAVEGIGGYLNAFTTEDHTCYYAKACSSHLPDLCDVLTDMYLNSQFPPAEIEREREVIGEEIRMYKDNPAHHVQELLSQTMWHKHPLGRPLTGTIESISALDRKRLMAFKERHYNGRTTIVTAAGKVSHDEVVAQIEPLLGRIPAGSVPRFSRYRVANSQPKVSLFTQETEQTHLAMAFYSFGRLDERRFALKLLSVILGENMSSRLFQKLREKYGFCYSVQSGMVALADAGVINISAGLDTGKLEKALRVILEEVEAFCHKAPSRAELRKAQDYTMGQTLMGMESTTNQMMWLGESLLGHGKVLAPAKIQEKIQAVTPEQIQAVACHCLKKARLGVAIVGPTKEAEQIKDWLK